MAFNLSTRFSEPPKSYQLLDPGSYQNTNFLVTKPNKIPFLSKTPRNTQPNVRLWTQAIYNGDLKPKIPNCTSLSSKVLRFSTYETADDENELIICQCGQQNTCECSIEKEKANIPDEQICQAAVRRRLYKGPAPRSELNKGKEFSTTKILPTGSKKTKVDGFPLYDARVMESSAFYRGYMSSRRASKRNNVTKSCQIPGPADYNINRRQPRYEIICAEKFRAWRRKTSKQLRFVEKVQRENIIQNFPGPASYSPILPKGTNLQCIGPKAERFFLSKYDDTPKPTTYFIKRDFDVNKSHFKPCRAKLPTPAPFSVKARRFKYRYEIGPSPDSFNVNNITCQLKHCNIAPFGSCSKRFTDNCKKYSLNFSDDDVEVVTTKKPYETNPLPTWEFRSKTVRMKPLAKMMNEPGPADLYLSKNYIRKRLLHLQCVCPFFSSEARFLNWFNWISVQGIDKTPGPASYNLEKRKCLPAVKIGPLNRSERFPYRDSQTPAPNTYQIDRGLFATLSTNNQRLKNNIQKTHQFVWKQPVEKRKLSLEEQELMLLNKSIALLDVPDIFKYSKSENKITAPQLVADKTRQPKLLRSFLYSTKVKKFY